MQIEQHKTDILILAPAAPACSRRCTRRRRTRPARDRDGEGLLGKCGCTRMVQGGYNVALSAGDSVERHFMDTIEGGKWLPRQDLAWRLVEGAVERVRELENEIGCFFDRNPDGSLHSRPSPARASTAPCTRPT